MVKSIFLYFKVEGGTYNLAEVYLVLLHLNAFLRQDEKSQSSG